MKRIEELFEYMKTTSDDELRYQLISFMKNYYHDTALNLGTANPEGRYRLRLRALMNDIKNLSDLINFCFENDIKLVIKELKTNEEQQHSELSLYSLKAVSEKLNLAPNTIRELMKSGELKYVRIQATGSKRRLKRFTIDSVNEYLKKHTQ